MTGPRSRPGGTPVLDGGYPRTGYSPGQVSNGVPSDGVLPGQTWSTPSQVRTGGTTGKGIPLARDGVPPARSGWGYPRMCTPWPEMGYLIRSGRYASCVHAGGLSCS